MAVRRAVRRELLPLAVSVRSGARAAAAAGEPAGGAAVAPPRAELVLGPGHLVLEDAWQDVVRRRALTLTLILTLTLTLTLTPTVTLTLTVTLALR